MRGEASPGFGLRLEKSTFLVCRREEPTASKARKRGSEEAELLSSMILVGKTKRKTATLSGSVREDGIRGDQAEEVEAEVDEEGGAVVSTEVGTGIFKELQIGKSKEVGAEFSEETESKIYDKDRIDKISMCFGAAKAEIGTEVEV